MRTGLLRAARTVVLLRRVVQRRAHDGRQPVSRLSGPAAWSCGPTHAATRVRVWVAGSGRQGHDRRRTRGAGHTPCFEPLLKRSRQSRRQRARGGHTGTAGGAGGGGARKKERAQREREFPAGEQDAAPRPKPEIIAPTVQSYILLGTWKSTPVPLKNRKTDVQFCDHRPPSSPMQRNRATLRPQQTATNAAQLPATLPALGPGGVGHSRTSRPCNPVSARRARGLANASESQESRLLPPRSRLPVSLRRSARLPLLAPGCVGHGLT